MIPKIIHFCWLSDEPYPEKIQKCMDSWKMKLSDYEIVCWDTRNFDINICPWTKQAFECKKYAFVADYVRFYALYNYGGIYLDSDVEVLKSFDDLLHKKCFWGYEYTGLPEAAVVGCEAKMSWLQVAMNWYESHNFMNDGGSYNQIIAPLVFKYAFEKFYGVSLIDDEKPHSDSDYEIFSYESFSPKNGFNGKIFATDNSYTVHHFNSAWLKKSFTTRIKKFVHIALIFILGKQRYNKVIYEIRKKHRVEKMEDKK